MPNERKLITFDYKVEEEDVYIEKSIQNLIEIKNAVSKTLNIEFFDFKSGINYVEK